MAFDVPGGVYMSRDEGLNAVPSRKALQYIVLVVEEELQSCTENIDRKIFGDDAGNHSADDVEGGESTLYGSGEVGLAISVVKESIHPLFQNFSSNVIHSLQQYMEDGVLEKRLLQEELPQGDRSEAEEVLRVCAHLKQQLVETRRDHVELEKKYRELETLYDGQKHRVNDVRKGLYKEVIKLREELRRQDGQQSRRVDVNDQYVFTDLSKDIKDKRSASLVEPLSPSSPSLASAVHRARSLLVAKYEAKLVQERQTSKQRIEKLEERCKLLTKEIETLDEQLTSSSLLTASNASDLLGSSDGQTCEYYDELMNNATISPFMNDAFATKTLSRRWLCIMITRIYKELPLDSEWSLMDFLLSFLPQQKPFVDLSPACPPGMCVARLFHTCKKFSKNDNRAELFLRLLVFESRRTVLTVVKAFSALRSSQEGLSLRFVDDSDVLPSYVALTRAISCAESLDTILGRPMTGVVVQSIVERLQRLSVPLTEEDFSETKSETFSMSSSASWKRKVLIVDYLLTCTEFL